MRTAVRLGLMLGTLLLAASMASAAIAAPAEWASMDITLIEEQGQTVLLVAGQLPETTELPAEVQIPVPAGAKVQWVGELMGGDGSGDFEVKYDKSTENGSDIYTLTLTKSRVAQVEGAIPPVTGFDGTTYVTSLSWTPIADVPAGRISVRLPSSAAIANVGQGEQGRLLAADSTYSYFSKTVEEVKAGEPLTLQFAYTLSAPSSTAGGTGGSNGLIVALIIALAIAVFALAFVAIRRKAAAADDDWATDDDETEQDQASDAANAVAHADEPVDGPADGEDDDARASVAKPALNPRTLVLIGVIAVAVLIGALAGNRSTTAQDLGGVITRSYGTGDACTTASIAIAPAKGVDLAKQGNTLLAGLEQIPGLGSASIFLEEGRVEIGYCDSSATEGDLRAALSATGLVEVAAAPTAVPGTATESTSVPE